MPVVPKTFNSQDNARFLEALQSRLDHLGWFSIFLLLASGILQMSASPHYEGFLSIRSLWAGLILIRHLLFGIMVVLNAKVTWWVLPDLRHEILLDARGKNAPNLIIFQR